MADDPYARIAQLEAEVAALRQREAELVAAAKRRNRVDAEATERQAATDDVLRIIAGSPTRLQPVLQAIAENAAQVCGAEDAHLRLLEEDQLRLVAAYGTVPGQSLGETFPAGPESAGGLAIIERRVIHIPDLAAEPAHRLLIARRLFERFGFRAALAAPLVRDGVPIGNIVLRRMEPRPFTDAQIRQLQTFADQAVIAIENARLLEELEQRNRDLNEALEQQTATAEVLRVIAASPADLPSVLRAIVESAVRLCQTD